MSSVIPTKRRNRFKSCETSHSAKKFGSKRPDLQWVIANCSRKNARTSLWVHPRSVTRDDKQLIDWLDEQLEENPRTRLCQNNQHVGELYFLCGMKNKVQLTNKEWDWYSFSLAECPSGYIFYSTTLDGAFDHITDIFEVLSGKISLCATSSS